MVRLLVLLAVTTFVLNYFFPEGEARYRRILVDGKSMDPTYVHGETLWMHALEYSDQTPQRGDVVVLGQEGHSPFYLKRIIGLPGERVAIRRGQMTIDGTVCDAFSIRGLQVDHLMQTTDGEKLCELDNGGVDHMFFDLGTFTNTVDPALFALPTGGCSKRCGMAGHCSIL